MDVCVILTHRSYTNTFLNSRTSYTPYTMFTALNLLDLIFSSIMIYGAGYIIYVIIRDLENRGIIELFAILAACGCIGCCTHDLAYFPSAIWDFAGKYLFSIGLIPMILIGLLLLSASLRRNREQSQEKIKTFIICLELSWVLVCMAIIILVSSSDEITTDQLVMIFLFYVSQFVTRQTIKSVIESYLTPEIEIWTTTTPEEEEETP